MEVDEAIPSSSLIFFKVGDDPFSSGLFGLAKVGVMTEFLKSISLGKSL